jgi:hypothetical protein
MSQLASYAVVLPSVLTVGQLQPAHLDGAEEGLNFGRDGLDIGPSVSKVE